MLSHPLLSLDLMITSIFLHVTHKDPPCGFASKSNEPWSRDFAKVLPWKLILFVNKRPKKKKDTRNLLFSELSFHYWKELVYNSATYNYGDLSILGRGQQRGGDLTSSFCHVYCEKKYPETFILLFTWAELPRLLLLKTPSALSWSQNDKTTNISKTSFCRHDIFAKTRGRMTTAVKWLLHARELF